MSNNIDKLNQLSGSEKSGWDDDAKFVHKNISWLLKMGKLIIAIRSRMKEMGMSQKQLAEELKVSAQRVSVILNGRENLSFETVCALDEIFNLHIFDNLLETEEQTEEKDVVTYTINHSLDYSFMDCAKAEKSDDKQHTA